MHQSSTWIEHKRHHSHRQTQGNREGRNMHKFAKQKNQQMKGPMDPKNGPQFHQLLVRQMVSWIQFKNQNMIDSSCSPTVDINTQKKQE